MSTVNRRLADRICRELLACSSMQEMADLFRSKLLPRIRGNRKSRNTWKYHAWKFLRFLESGSPEFKIFKSDGNSKLKFWTFSSLPGHDCPGAGDCLRYCYSFRAWRYPAAFFRQLQNSILLRHGKATIAGEWRRIPYGKQVRLYVDGDFASASIVAYWMRLCYLRGDLKIYGYSKSWSELLAFDASTGGAWPDNYVLNVSGGSLHDLATRDRIMQLPIARQVFDGVQIELDDLPRGFDRYKSKTYHARVREAYYRQTGHRAFSCPGICSNCRVNSGHACGDAKFIVPIAIGVH